MLHEFLVFTFCYPPQHLLILCYSLLNEYMFFPWLMTPYLLNFFPYGSGYFIYLAAFINSLFPSNLFFFFWPFRAILTAYESSQTWPAYTTDTAKPGPSCICNLHHSLPQCQILNPLSEARDGTSILMDTSQIHCH